MVNVRHVLCAGLCLLACISGTEGGLGGDPGSSTACEDGWLHMQENLNIFNSGLCIQINPRPRSWSAAEKHCEEQISNLMYMDRQFLYKSFIPRTESFENIGDLLVSDNITEWWSGMHVKNGRLMWDDYGPSFVRWTSPNGWEFANGEPNPNNGTCGKVTTGKSFNDVEFVYSGQMSIGLDDCSRSLPYICQKSPIVRDVYPADFCEESWYGNQYLPHCFRLFKDKQTYSGAAEACGDQGGSLVASGTLFTNTFLGTVLQKYLPNLESESTTEPPLFVDYFWVKTALVQGNECDVFNVTKFTIGKLSCQTQHRYMCSKPTQYKGTEKFKIESIYLDQTELLKYEPFKQLTVSGILSRPLLSGEVGFLHTPTTIINSTGGIYNQWDRNVFFNPNPTYDVTARPVASSYYVNVTLPRYIVPSRRRRGLSLPGIGEEFPFPIDVDYDYVSQTVGYYSFDIYNINPPRHIKTPPVLIRYSEHDLFIYVMYIDQQPEDEFVFDNVMAQLTNLLGTDRTMLGEMAGGLFFLSQDPTFNTLRTNVEYINFSKRTVKYRLFMAPPGARYQGRSLEQSILQLLTEVMQQRIETQYADRFDPRSLIIRSTVACPFFETTRGGYNLTFPSTPFGSRAFSWERCYPENKARAYATCDQGGYDDGVAWGEIVVTSGCGSVPEYNVSSSTANLKNLSETEFNSGNFRNILEDTKNLTGPTVNLTEADIVYTADILYNYLTFSTEYTENAMETVFEILNNVLHAQSGVVELAQRITNAANRIIRSVDDLTFLLNVPPALPATNGNSLQFVQDFVAGQVWQQSGTGEITIGINLDNATDDVIDASSLTSIQSPDDVGMGKTDTAIYITKTLVEGSETKLAFHIYSRTSLFTVISSKFKVNSKVAAARLSKDGIDVVKLDGEQLTAVFQTFEEDEALVCAYWDYAANEDAGGWRTDGCTTIVGEDKKTVTCTCNHLTNFAVLIDLEAHTISDTDKLVLGIITKVGLVLSIIGLGLTILTFLVFKHLRSGRGQQVLVNLSVAMLCSAILFLAGIERTESYGGCIAVSVLLHYFILVSFMWMLIEGILQYLRFVKVLGTYIPKFMIKSMIPAWGIPLIPVIIVLAIDYDLYFGGNGYCWLKKDAMLYAFIIPVAVVILANLIVFVMVLCNLFRRRKKGMVSNQSERKMAMLHLQAAVSVFVILGLTWVFGFLAIEDARIVFHYLFAIFNAFQGFFIFLLFTFRETQIRKAWRKLCCKGSAYKSTTSSDSHPHKHTTSDTNSTDLMGSKNNEKRKLKRKPEETTQYPDEEELKTFVPKQEQT